MFNVQNSKQMQFRRLPKFQSQSVWHSVIGPDLAVATHTYNFSHTQLWSLDRVVHLILIERYIQPVQQDWIFLGEMHYAALETRMWATYIQNTCITS